MPAPLRQVLRIGGKNLMLLPQIPALFGISCVASVRYICSEFSKLEKRTKMPSSSIVMKYTKVVPEAYPPTKGSVKAAGYDLKSAYDCTVPARGKALVDTGIKVQLPEGCYGRIAPRSGLAVKNFIDVGGENFCRLTKIFLLI
jgi:hypothetical protein